MSSQTKIIKFEMRGESTAVKVFQIFKQIQLEGSDTISLSHRYSLEELLRTDCDGFIDSMEQAYLQICKAISSSKKPTEKFSNLMRDLSQSLEKMRNAELVPRHGEPEVPVKHILRFLGHTIGLFSEIALSTYKNIRIFGARTLFMILHSVKLHEFADELEPAELKMAASCVQELLREKINDYRKYGIKIASALQLIMCPELQSSIDSIVHELLRIISTDDNENIRLLAVKNLVLRQSTLKQFFLRLRDKSPEIRVTVFRKLIAEKVAIHELGLSNLYKVFYDGISSRESLVKNECINCFSSYLQPSSANTQSNSKYADFVVMFCPEMLLHQPHLYTSFSELLSKVLESMGQASSRHFGDYLKHLCLELKKGRPPTPELVYLRVACALPQYSSIIEQFFLNGVELADMLLACFKNNRYFEFYEGLQLAGKFINTDETGRNKLYTVLLDILSQPNKHTIQIPNHMLSYESDVCKPVDYQQIQRLRLLTPFYQDPVIHDTEDLVTPIVRALKSIRPEHFSNDLQELASDIKPDSPENNLMRERELLLSNLQRVQKEKKQEEMMLRGLENKTVQLEGKIAVLKGRVLSILRALLELSNSVSEELLKGVLGWSQGPQRILLEGLSGLSSVERGKVAFQHAWQQLNSGDRMGQMVSLLVCSDLVIKFNLLKHVQDVGLETEEFSNAVGRLMFSTDYEVRAVAIECMCKLLFNGKAENFNLGFLYVLLLWWDTNAQGSSCRAVHIISSFVKQFLEKEPQHFFDMSHLLQVFFRTLNMIHSSRKVINRDILLYTLKWKSFVKRALQIAMTILRYTRPDGTLRQVGRRSQDLIEMPPQQSFVLFIIRQKNFEPFVESTLQVCDCLKEASPEVLKLLQESIQEASTRTGAFKAKAFLGEIDRILTVKGDPEETTVAAYREEFQRRYQEMGQEARQVLKNITELGILTNDPQPQSDDDESAFSDEQPESAPISESESQSSDQGKHRPKRTKRT